MSLQGKSTRTSGPLSLILGSLAYLAIGIKHTRLQVFISTAYLSSLATLILVIYLTGLPINDATQGAYLVAVVMAGLLAGAAAIFFQEVTEGFACLLGGFCLSMWLLTLQSGGLIKSASGKVAFISVLSLAAFSTSLSRYTRRQSLIVTTAFGGATAVVLGIDCFTRAGLKEFWVWIWHINEDLFSLGSTTYPLSRGMKAETVIIVIISLLGIVSQAEIWRIIQKRRKSRLEKRRLLDQRTREEHVRPHSSKARGDRLAGNDERVNNVLNFGSTRDFRVVYRQYRPEAYSLMVTGLNLGDSNLESSKATSRIMPTLVELESSPESIPAATDTAEAHDEVQRMSMRAPASSSEDPMIDEEMVADEISRQTSIAPKASDHEDDSRRLASEETPAQASIEASEDKLADIDIEASESLADIDIETSEFQTTHQDFSQNSKRLSSNTTNVQATARSSGCYSRREDQDEHLDDAFSSAAATLDAHDLWNPLGQRLSSSKASSDYECRRESIFSTLHDDFGSEIEKCFIYSSTRPINQLTRFSMADHELPLEENSEQLYDLNMINLPSQLPRVALTYRTKEWAKHVSLVDKPPAEHDEAFLRMLDGGTEAAVPVDMMSLRMSDSLMMPASDASTLVQSAQQESHSTAQVDLESVKQRPASLKPHKTRPVSPRTSHHVAIPSLQLSLSPRAFVSPRAMLIEESSRCSLARPAFRAPSLLDQRDLLLQSRASCYRDAQTALEPAYRSPASLPSAQRRGIAPVQAQMDLKLAGFRASVQEDLQKVAAGRSWGRWDPEKHQLSDINLAMMDRHRQAMRRLQSQAG